MGGSGAQSRTLRPAVIALAQLKLDVRDPDASIRYANQALTLNPGLADAR